jgi:hypothetical protein
LLLDAITSLINAFKQAGYNPPVTDLGAPLNPIDGWEAAPLDAPSGWWYLLENPVPEPVIIAANAECAKLVEVS